MQTFSAETLKRAPFRFVGALDFDQRKQGISPRRLPDWTRSQVPGMMDVMVRMPAGVRLVFTTDSRRIGLTVMTTTMVTPPAAPRAVVFDLVADGVVTSQVFHGGNLIVLDPANPGEFELQRGQAGTLWFELPAGEKSIELWLPHNAFVEVRDLQLDPGATLGPAADGGHRWVHYGSSISHCMEAQTPTGTWPAVAARQAGLALIGLGLAGQCHLDPFVARTIRELDVELISIKAGINLVNMDSMRERVFVPALHGFLDTIRERHLQTPIVLISPIFCPSAEEHPGPTVADANGRFVTVRGGEDIRQGCLSLTRIRMLIAEVVNARRAAGDLHLHYVDGLTLFGPADAGDLPDDLHPNAAGYARMGQRFATSVLAGLGYSSQSPV